jgi:hypothetical protein
VAPPGQAKKILPIYLHPSIAVPTFTLTSFENPLRQQIYEACNQFPKDSTPTNLPIKTTALFPIACATHCLPEKNLTKKKILFIISLSLPAKYLY